MVPEPVYVYLAGPYSSGPLDEHIAAVVDAAEILRRHGLVPFIPHTMMFLWAVRYQHPRVYWMDLDNQWLKRCDIVLRVRGMSQGADSEIQLALALGKPVFINVESCIQWAEARGTPEPDNEGAGRANL